MALRFLIVVVVVGVFASRVGAQDVKPLSFEVGVQHAWGQTDIPDFVGAHGVGVRGAVTRHFGFSDAWGLQTALNYSAHPKNSKVGNVGLLEVEAQYALDVVKAVPVFSVGAFGLMSGNAPAGRQIDGDFGFHAGLELLIWLRPTRALGLGTRIHYAVLRNSPLADPLYITSGISFRWKRDPFKRR